MIRVSRGSSLDRYYLFKFFGLALFLHRIHHSDSVGLYHSHPWNGISLILGSYVETIQSEAPRRRWFCNWIEAGRHHRVEVKRPTWTLFFHFRRSCRWSVIDESGVTQSVEPWRGEAGLKDYAKT